MMWSSLTLLLDPVMDIGSVEFNICYYEYLAYPRGDTTPLVCVVVMVIKLNGVDFIGTITPYNNTNAASQHSCRYLRLPE